MKKSKLGELMKKNAVMVLTLSGIMVIAIVVMLVTNRAEKEPDPSNRVDLNDTTGLGNENPDLFADLTGAPYASQSPNPQDTGNQDGKAGTKMQLGEQGDTNGNEFPRVGEDEPLDLDGALARADGNGEGAGTQGVDGQQTADATQGIDGQQTADGTQGTDGQQTADGTQGTDGQQTADGAQGIDGQQTADGAQNADGTQGTDGQQTADGAQGIGGQQTADGAQNADGTQGVDGQQTADGTQGIDGQQTADGTQVADSTGNSGEAAVETSGGSIADGAPSAPQELSQEAMAAISALVFRESQGLLWPVTGDIVMNYSVDHLIYHETLSQFRTHPAVAISAPAGTAVNAAADGIVVSVETLAQTGTTVTTAIGSDYYLVYGQLADCTLVPGDSVTAGENIGTVGAATRFYSCEGDNLYFQLRCGEESRNPMSLLQMPENDVVNLTETEADSQTVLP